MSNTENKFLTPLPRFNMPPHCLNKYHVNSKHQKLLDRAGIVLEKNKKHDIPFEMLFHPFPADLFPKIHDMALNYIKDEGSIRQKYFLDSLMSFCFKNKHILSFNIIKHTLTKTSKILDLSFTRLIPFYSQADTLKDIDFLVNQYQINKDKEQIKDLTLALIDKPGLIEKALELSSQYLSKDRVVESILPHLNNPEALESLFTQSYLTPKDAVSGNLIGPYVIKQRDEMLNILYKYSNKGFLNKLADMHINSLSFTLPYISRNSHQFTNDKDISKLKKAVGVEWVNEYSKKDLNKENIIVLINKDDIKSNIKSKNKPSKSRKF